jgi:acyl-CoA reductase-like NAD-dependent aldehyde dehydrogenase
MERIVLEVDGALARAWRNSPPALRSSYERKIADLLRELKEAEFDSLLDKAGKIAEENGLTEEQLEILKAEAAENTGRYEWWNDEDMLAELDQIAADLKSGKDPGISWDTLKKDLLSRGKKDAI